VRARAREGREERTLVIRVIYSHHVHGRICGVREGGREGGREWVCEVGNTG
jgi:hypothetical protein